MRIAVVSDIHGNRAAFEGVLADLRQTSPDVIFHGGDLASSGSSPVEIVDRIRDLGWLGVVGNTDEMLYSPETLTAFASQTPAMQPFLKAIEDLAAAARQSLGEERLA
jgi:predicted phosphodiesterase